MSDGTSVRVPWEWNDVALLIFYDTEKKNTNKNLPAHFLFRLFLFSVSKYNVLHFVFDQHQQSKKHRRHADSTLGGESSYD